jgi:glycosyltransferase involved in cell wall biosynthesis
MPEIPSPSCPPQSTGETAQADPQKKSLFCSFVVPIYNDGYLASGCCEEFQAVFSRYLKRDSIEQDVELIFVNDGSVNASLPMLKDLAQRHAFVKVIDLSRNFGQHIAILCGYHHASGSYVGRINVDMQDPPRELPKLLDAIQQEDIDIAIGLQRQRHSGWLDIVTSRLFFLVFNALIGGSIPPNTATLRIMNRRYVEALKQMNDKFPFLQGLESWIGFKVKYIPTDHQERVDKKSSYTFKKRLRLALNASISFSDRPLKATVYLGLMIALLGFLGLGLIVIRRLMTPDILPGYTSTLAVILFCSGVQILVIGLSGLYIGKILGHVQNRPLFLVRERINF